VCDLSDYCLFIILTIKVYYIHFHYTEKLCDEEIYNQKYKVNDLFFLKRA